MCSIRAATDWIRKHKKMRLCPINYSDSDEGTEDLRLVTFSDTAEQKKNQEIAANLLKQGIQSLPPQRRKIMELLYFCHETPQQIAKTMGLTHQTVLNHKARAVETLSELLRPKYEEAVYG
jgi:RNA polymerase sigma factor (sigma-70 family)